MANAFATQQKISNVFLFLLKNFMVGGKVITNRSEEFTKSANQPALGDTVYVRRTVEFTVRDGKTFSGQDIVVGKAPLTIDKQKGVDLKLTTKEASLDYDKLLENETIRSQAAILAQQIDSDILDRSLEFAHWVGTPGEVINSVADFNVMMQRAIELGIPMESMNGVLSPNDFISLANTFTGQDAGGFYKEAITKLKIPMLSTAQPYMSQNTPRLTTGTRTNGTVNGASQNVTYLAVKDAYSQTLNVTGLGNGGTVKKGEVFTIAGVNAINPRKKNDLGYLQKFTVLADATANASGEAALSIACPIITSGAYQTVSAAPANGAAVTWMGDASTTYDQNSVFHRSAIALVSVKPTAPKSGMWSYSTDPQTGITIRLWEQSDINNDEHLSRIDVLYGTAAVDRRLGVRGSGTLSEDLLS